MSGLLDIWGEAEARARAWRWLCVAQFPATALALGLAYRGWTRPLPFIRVGCDGVPEVLAIEERVYRQPSDLEMGAFAGRFAIWYLRADSWSVEQDYAEAAQWMEPGLRDRFREEGARQAVVIRRLRRRTTIPEGSVQVTMDKTRFPWVAKVSAVRQVVAADGRTTREEPAGVTLELVRTERTLKNPFGLLVYDIPATHNPLAAPEEG